jgi:hypothetical protein
VVINTNKKVYDCFYCGAKIIFDEAVRSEKTNKRLPIDLDTDSRTNMVSKQYFESCNQIGNG